MSVPSTRISEENGRAYLEKMLFFVYNNYLIMYWKGRSDYVENWYVNKWW